MTSGRRARRCQQPRHRASPTGRAVAPRAAHRWRRRLDAVEVSAWFGDTGAGRVSLRCPRHGHRPHRPSGCGKSTFLRILNRMHESVPGAKMAGEVFLDGEDIYAPGPRYRRTPADRHGLPEAQPVPAMSIADNVTAGLTLTGTKVSRSDRAELVETCLHGPACGTRSRTGWRGRAPRCRAASSSGSASPARSPSAQGPLDGRTLLGARPRPRPAGSRRRSPSCARRSPSSSSPTTCSRRPGSPSRPPSSWPSRAHPGVIVESRPDRPSSSTTPSDPRTADYVHGRFG